MGLVGFALCYARVCIQKRANQMCAAASALWGAVGAQPFTANLTDRSYTRADWCVLVCFWSRARSAARPSVQAKLRAYSCAPNYIYLRVSGGRQCCQTLTGEGKAPMTASWGRQRRGPARLLAQTRGRARGPQRAELHGGRPRAALCAPPPSPWAGQAARCGQGEGAAAASAAAASKRGTRNATATAALAGATESYQLS